MSLNILDLLLPREIKFFTHMNKHIDFLVEGATYFQDMISQIETLSPDDFKAKLKEIQRCEKEMDDVEATIIGELGSTFITPLDREDIHTLAIQIDRAMDIINGVAKKLDNYHIRQVPNNVKRMADINVQMARLLREIMHMLQSKKDVTQNCERLHSLENECDDLFHSSVADLFSDGADPITVIKFKEIYEMLESSSDTIDYVGKLIRGIRVKQG